jgi:hypothetical protein
MMAEKWVWLIGGSAMAEPMIKEIAKRGYKLILTDGDVECPGRALSDIFHHLNVYDVKSHQNFGKAIHRGGCGIDEIVAILTIGTDAGPTVSALSEIFNLPGIGRKKADLVKDKIKMRRKLELPHPFYFIHNKGEAVGYFTSDKFPLVIKAPDLAGSKGFEIANNNEQLREIVQNRQEFQLLFEQLLISDDLIPQWRDLYGFDTSEAAFDFFIEDGQAIYANGALRMFWEDYPGIEAGHINPFEADEQVLAIAQDVAESFNLSWGVLKIDMKKDKRYGWCLLECATRLSGGWDHMGTAPLATGRDITGVMLDVALGQPLDQEKLMNVKNRFACCYAPVQWPGKIKKWKMENGNYTCHINKHEKIPKLESNQDRPVFIIAEGLTPDEALKSALAVDVRPVYKR